MVNELTPKELKRLDKLTSDVEFTSDGINQLVSFVRQNVSTTLARYLEKLHEQVEDLEGESQLADTCQAEADMYEEDCNTLQKEKEELSEQIERLKADNKNWKITCGEYEKVAKRDCKIFKKLKKFVDNLEETLQ